MIHRFFFGARSVSTGHILMDDQDDEYMSVAGGAVGGTAAAEAEGTRTLLVTRDSITGYGLTLGGEQPVFVQTVRPGGAADRAGVKENDVIVKVNNRRVVTEATHQEVVNLIQGKKEETTLLLFRAFAF